MLVFAGISVYSAHARFSGIFLFAMDDFIQYLSRKRIVSPKQRQFFAIWVRNFYHFLERSPGQPVSNDDAQRFLASLDDTHQDWQVQQAKDAIQLYRYYPRPCA